MDRLGRKECMTTIAGRMAVAEPAVCVHQSTVATAISKPEPTRRVEVREQRAAKRDYIWVEAAMAAGTRMARG